MSNPIFVDTQSLTLKQTPKPCTITQPGLHLNLILHTTWAIDLQSQSITRCPDKLGTRIMFYIWTAGLARVGSGCSTAVVACRFYF